jgi:Na+-driven multidrug efflux pump
MSATSVLGGLIQLRQLRIRAHDFEPLQGYFSSCWEMGRWWFYARLVGVFSSLAFPWALAMGQGPEQTATFQALLTVLALTNPVLFSINNLVLTRVARQRAMWAGSNTIAVALRSARTGFALIVPYLLVVFFYPQQVASLFYGSASPYLVQPGLLKILAFAYLMETIACVSLAILGGLQKTPFVFATQCVAALIALLICLPAAYYWGPRYAAMGFACVVTVKAFVSSFLVLRTLEQRVVITEPPFEPHGFQLLVK